MTHKNQPFVILILIAIFCIVLIGNKSASSQTNATSKANYKVVNYDISNLASERDRVMVTDVFVDYMLLKNSLAKNNLADAQLTIETMIKVIADYRQTMDPKYLPSSKKFTEDMAALKEKVNKSTTLEENRINFSILNNSFMEFIKSYGMKNKTIYLFQCNENKEYGNGYWMSDVKNDTRNPYADGNENSDCVNVKEIWTYK